MEKLIIKNFAGISELEMELNKFNVFIGPSGSGKSVVAKLIYFFKQVPFFISKGFFDQRLDKESITINLLSAFTDIFTPLSLGQYDYFISFTSSLGNITVTSNVQTPIKFEGTYLRFFTQGEHFNESMGKKSMFFFNAHDLTDITAYSARMADPTPKIAEPLYLPEDRIFMYSLKSSMFSAIRANILNLGSVFLDFAATFEGFKEPIHKPSYSVEFGNEVARRNKQILKGTYLKEFDREYIVHNDGRKVLVKDVSSGQKAALPLTLTFQHFFNDNIENGSFFIEEPEAHLFPAQQRDIVELIALYYNFSKGTNSILLTTHSPYVLTSLNNLIEAGIVEEKLAEADKERLYKIVDKDLILRNNCVTVFAFEKGTAKSCMDEETGLIGPDYMDSVTEDIETQFSSLLDLKYEDNDLE